MRTLATLALAAATLTAAAPASAQDWPTRSAKIIVAFSPGGLLTSGEQIKAGGVTAVAVTSTECNPVYKDIPTFTEQGYPEVHGDTWFWLTGPKNLPPEIVEKLNREVRRIVKTAKVRDYFQRQAALAMDVDVAGLNTFLAGEVAYWGALAKSVGLSVQ